jgi:hypothetical protein
MGCSLFPCCERALTVVDAATLRARRILLMIELRARQGAPTPLPPEVIHIAATLVPVTYEQSGEWYECPYREWLLMDELTWRAVAQARIARLSTIRVQIREELEEAAAAEGGEVGEEAFAFDDIVHSRQRQHDQEESDCVLTSWMYGNDFLRGRRSYAAFALLHTELGQRRAPESGVERLACMHSGWPREAVERRNHEEAISRQWAHVRAGDDRTWYADFHSFAHCYLHELFRVDWDEACGSAERSGRDPSCGGVAGGASAATSHALGSFRTGLVGFRVGRGGSGEAQRSIAPTADPEDTRREARTRETWRRLRDDLSSHLLSQRRAFRAIVLPRHEASSSRRALLFLPRLALYALCELFVACACACTALVVRFGLEVTASSAWVAAVVWFGYAIKPLTQILQLLGVMRTDEEREEAARAARVAMLKLPAGFPRDVLDKRRVARRFVIGDDTVAHFQRLEACMAQQGISPSNFRILFKFNN